MIADLTKWKRVRYVQALLFMATLWMFMAPRMIWKMQRHDCGKGKGAACHYSQDSEPDSAAK